jgi:hypothetical protein
MSLYDAFISYSHAKDKPIAVALQRAVQALGKPWYQLRALRVFRDDTSPSATPRPRSTVSEAIAQSRYLILLASPESSASPQVNKEVAFWLERNSADRLLIGVTEGTPTWDNAAGDFVGGEGVLLPPALKGKFSAEPMWVDLSANREGVGERDARFIELAADFAAVIRGMPKEDLVSQEVRQQRRALRLALGAAASLLILATVAAWQWRAAVENERATTEQKQIAQQQANLAVSLFKVGSVSDPAQARAPLREAIEIVDTLARAGGLTAAQAIAGRIFPNVCKTLCRSAWFLNDAAFLLN